uniref:Chromosome 4 open reading frame 19 n=1 Tax=Catagonus wagneri TaxID=51154 RepID=A0A8C3WYD6_9CETA
MGCRCCKMIQSYLFDPVQVPSPGYVNEVNSCKLDEDDTVKLKGRQSSEALVRKSDLPGKDSVRTASTSVRDAAPEPCWPPQGPLLLGDPAGGPRAGAVNGLGPTAALQLTGDPEPPQGDGGSQASTANRGHPTQPSLEGGSARAPDCVLLALEEARVTGHGDSGAPSTAAHPAREVRDHGLWVPAPDYPPFGGPAEDDADGEEKDCLFEIPRDEVPQEGAHPRAEEQGSEMPFSVKRSRDSLNEAVATDILSVCFREEPTQDVPMVDSRNGWQEAPGSPGDGSGEPADEDAEVAEALAALEAATAGEEVDEAD